MAWSWSTAQGRGFQHAPGMMSELAKGLNEREVILLREETEFTITDGTKRKGPEPEDLCFDHPLRQVLTGVSTLPDPINRFFSEFFAGLAGTFSGGTGVACRAMWVKDGASVTPYRFNDFWEDMAAETGFAMVPEFTAGRPRDSRPWDWCMTALNRLRYVVWFPEITEVRSVHIGYMEHSVNVPGDCPIELDWQECWESFVAQDQTGTVLTVEPFTQTSRSEPFIDLLVTGVCFHTDPCGNYMWSFSAGANMSKQVMFGAGEIVGEHVAGHTFLGTGAIFDGSDDDLKTMLNVEFIAITGETEVNIVVPVGSQPNTPTMYPLPINLVEGGGGVGLSSNVLTTFCPFKQTPWPTTYDENGYGRNQTAAQIFGSLVWETFVDLPGYTDFSTYATYNITDIFESLNYKA